MRTLLPNGIARMPVIPWLNLQDLSAHRIACLTGPCPSHKKPQLKTLKYDTHANVSDNNSSLYF